KRMQLRELILRQRLCRKQIQRAARRVLQNRVEHRRVVTEGFSRRCRRDDDDVAMAEGVLDRVRLMRVDLVDAAAAKRACQSRVERGREWRILRGNRRQPADSGDVTVWSVGPGDVCRWKSRRQPVESLFECGGAL